MKVRIVKEVIACEVSPVAMFIISMMVVIMLMMVILLVNPEICQIYQDKDDEEIDDQDDNAVDEDGENERKPVEAGTCNKGRAGVQALLDTQPGSPDDH